MEIDVAILCFSSIFNYLHTERILSAAPFAPLHSLNPFEIANAPSQYALSLNTLSTAWLIASGNVFSSSAGELISRYLRGCPDFERQVFLMRYYFGMSASGIAKRMKCGESKVKMTLLRTREKLAAYLTKEGIML